MESPVSFIYSIENVRERKILNDVYCGGIRLLASYMCVGVCDLSRWYSDIKNCPDLKKIFILNRDKNKNYIFF